MSDFAYAAESSPSHPDFADFTYHKKGQNLTDFAFVADDSILTPNPSTEEFDSELDALIEGIDFDLLTVPTSNPEAFQYRQPPASAFTFSSSESSYDSARSESSYASSPRDTASNYSLIPEIDSELKNFGIEAPALDFNNLDCIDPAVFDLMLSPSHSPAIGSTSNIAKPSGHCRTTSSFADYGPSTGNILTPDFFTRSSNFMNPTASIGQQHIVPSIPLMPFSTEDVHRGNPRRKYKCTAPGCSRAFDRAFNLKTHMETHDPNRARPFVCPHPSCGRPFSRKHDLGRHQASIHKDDASPIGVGKNSRRTWCESCGKSSVSTHTACGCIKPEEVKVK